jgi:type IV pilus assembly protein PilX
MSKVMHRSLAWQRGVVLIFTLIVLVILTIGAVALIRSMDTSLFSAGNLAFRRDLVNQGEQALANVMAEFEGGGALVSPATTDANQIALNYSAVILSPPPGGHDVPAALTDDATFATVGLASNDITGRTPDVQIRYVIDRLCSVTGIASSNLCVQSTALPTGGTANGTQAVTPPSATVYRLSVRVSGPRSTQVFLQSTFTKPD